MAIQAEMVATADKGVFSFSFILANMVSHIHCRMCRLSETQKWKKKKKKAAI